MGSFTRHSWHGSKLDEGHSHTRIPRTVQWMLSVDCPLSCAHCLSAASPGSFAPMPPPGQARFVEQVAELGVEELLITGGEPLVQPDLERVIGMLRTCGVRWSLNTALMPTRRLRAVLETWPPCFVAVSLDGPARVHDRFRGGPGAQDQALQSIHYFSEIVPGGQVAAGTTVTTHNYASLGETFNLVLGSGASSWGLHLLLPEGRARERRDLFLDRGQLRDLLRFAAAKRNHFPVALADEIGYCGPLEPLVRDTPFFCGAGRAGCVVLPDGEVVPCTTLDRTTSAGNVQRQTLARIWSDGFAELRAWTPEGSCSECRYAPACQGGCWLQRRQGAQCFKPVWKQVHPRTPTRKVMAVCLGLGLGLSVAGIGGPPLQAKPREPAKSSPAKPSMELLQRSIIRWYASQTGGRAPTARSVMDGLKKQLPGDPGAQYFLAYVGRKRAPGITARAKAIRRAVTTRQRSLCLVGLAWRDLTEWCLDGPKPAKRSTAERAALRQALTHLGKTAESWRREVFARKLDPFLRRPRNYRTFWIKKSAPPRSLTLGSGLAAKRGWSNRNISKEFLEKHAHAEVMELKVQVRAGSVKRARRGATKRLSAKSAKLGVFDLLVVGKGSATLKVAGLLVKLPPGTELAYADLLRLVHEQHPKQVQRLTRRVSPLALPALRARLKKNGRDRDARWRLINLYLF